MRIARHALAAALTLSACGDDAGGSKSDSSSSTEDSGADDGSSSQTGSATGVTMDGGASSDDGPTSATGTASSGDTTAADTTGGPSNRMVLQNDSWSGPADGNGITWEVWPGPGDCIASVYDIDPGLYPFTVEAVRAQIGDGTDTQSFEVGIWEVDGNNVPMTEIGSATVDLQGEQSPMPEIDLANNGITVPAITDGTFAAVLCHVDHRGAPSFSEDRDGTIAADGNFIFQVAAGDWVAAPDFVSPRAGDFILRAVIELQ